jgi:hypothetical protein
MTTCNLVHLTHLFSITAYFYLWLNILCQSGWQQNLITLWGVAVVRLKLVPRFNFSQALYSYFQFVTMCRRKYYEKIYLYYFLLNKFITAISSLCGSEFQNEPISPWRNFGSENVYHIPNLAWKFFFSYCQSFLTPRPRCLAGFDNLVAPIPPKSLLPQVLYLNRKQSLP